MLFTYNMLLIIFIHIIYSSQFFSGLQQDLTYEYHFPNVPKTIYRYRASRQTNTGHSIQQLSQETYGVWRYVFFQ